MKNILTVLIFCILFFNTSVAQHATPQLLNGPANWSFERFELPPSFAPAFPYKGAEELRFSPGMFNKDSVNYFTYAFVAELQNTTAISQNDIRDYLLIYFKGLCGNTAKDRKLVIDTTKITAAVEKKKSSAADETIYNASLDIFGVFADGAPVKLNMEVKVLMIPPSKKTYLIVIASPRTKTDDVWKELYMIQKNFTIPADKKN